MKLREIAKTIESMNKINEMLGNTKVCMSLWLDGINIMVHTTKDLKKVKELYIDEVAQFILNYDFTQETTTLACKLSWQDEAINHNVEIYVYEERR